MAEDVDFVSDLNGGGDTTISVNEGDVSTHGADAVQVNKGVSRAAPAQSKAVGKKVESGEPAHKALSLRDQISSALKGDDDTPPVASQDGKVRNPDGTFAPKPAAPDPVAPDPVVPDPAAAAPRTVVAPTGIDPEVFKTLPAETQASLARTMEGIAQSQQRFAGLAQVEQLIAPRRQAWALNGMTENQAIGQLLALSDFAGRDPSGFVQYFAKNNGVNLEDLVLGAEPVDPKFAALEKQLADLQSARTRDTQQQQQAAHTNMVNGVAAFASEKGQDNQPLRPYFDELGQDVLPFVSAVKAQNPTWTHNQVLQEAYDRACWGTPSVRSKMQAAADAAGEAERLRQGAAKVEQARAAGVGVRNGTPAAPASVPAETGKSLRETIRASIAASS